jgi:hypothetical protein
MTSPHEPAPTGEELRLAERFAASVRAGDETTARIQLTALYDQCQLHAEHEPEAGS